MNITHDGVLRVRAHMLQRFVFFRCTVKLVLDDFPNGAHFGRLNIPVGRDQKTRESQSKVQIVDEILVLLKQPLRFEYLKLRR